MVDRQRVMILIAGAFFCHVDDIRHQRESYAVTLVSKFLTGCTDEEKNLATRELMEIRVVPPALLDKMLAMIQKAANLFQSEFLRKPN